MVQRKAPSKLGVQADHVKPEKRSGNLKPNSCQHQEGKNRGPDMKKKMKRSRSIKLSDIESLKSSPPPLRKSMPQPGKPPPPPLNAPATEATPQKQLIIKTTDGSPNYMKSTSSSEARKERSLVSPLNTQTGSDGKNLHRRNSGSSRFSPASVALCADVSAQTSTCSSTLKDSKFPPYLMLNPGGTESEGTSVVKARRHSLKVQKSMKWEVLSPRRARPSGEGTEEIHGDRPMIQETGNDFFIEFFSKDTEDGAFSGEPEGRVNESCFYTSHEAAAEQDSNNQVSESSSDESQESEIDFEENSNDTDAPETDERDGDADTCSSTLSGEEATMGSCENWSDSERGMPSKANFLLQRWLQKADDLNKPDEDEFGTKVEGTQETKKLDWLEDSEIIISDDAVSNCTEEILADEVLQELFAEETASIDMQCSDSDPESDGIPHYWEILESIQGARDLAYDQESSAEDAFEELKTEEAREKNQDEGVHEMENDVNETLSQIGDDENDCTADISAEVLNGHQEDTSLQTDHASMRLSEPNC
ncbi:CALMODULIN-BINDING PROTEIN-RELATED [Salix purpurea]|uniref:CALMODULIN-BINDING PROTEIN-RELATED n=1 Tax=Salix purpurea TaxID=77065 RepID=A0A9Q0YX98_SALPP|nr:CALMODULIN-BINDING PROTEIN-RELATED [Salix purpurea]